MRNEKKLINLSVNGPISYTFSNANMEGISEKLLEYIKGLDEIQRFFIWLYQPITAVDINEVIRVQKQIGLSDYLFLRKMIILCRIQKMDLDETVDFLESKGLIKRDVDDMLIIQETLEADIMFNPLDMMIVHKIVESAKRFIASREHKVEHNNYPMVDEQNGRPQLGWVKCYHYGCNFRGNSADHLRNHLSECDAYTAYFHKMHENIVTEMNLIPEKVVADGLTKCPSPVCNKHNVIMKPEELIQHFKRLGISPFWKRGDKLDYDEENKREFNAVNQKPIFSCKKCVVCIDTHPTVLFMECNHHVVCMKCSSGIEKCPMCQVPIKAYIYY